VTSEHKAAASDQEYEARRKKLAARIRELRLEKELTGRELASASGVSQSKISKIETNQQLPTGEDITKHGTALRLPSKATDELVREAHALANEFLTWDSASPRGLRRRQESIAALERRTDLIRIFQPLVIPGLLQTAEYAQTIMRLSADYAEEDVEAGVAARLGRQSILFSDEHQFEFLLHENALRVRLGNIKMMRAQIDRLRNLMTLSNVAVMVIPWHTQLPAIPMVGFIIYDEQLVSIELPSNRGEIRRPRDIAAYLDAYNALKGVALADNATLDTLTALDNEYQALEHDPD
jgi:transcriptional regulator with XRE-family HTH domain